MKYGLLRTLCLALMLCTGFGLRAQQFGDVVVSVVQTTHNHNCGNDAAGVCCGCFISICNDPEPRWRVRANLGGGNFGPTAILDQGTNGCGTLGWNAGIYTYANTCGVTVEVQSWEDDGGSGQVYDNGGVNPDDNEATNNFDINYWTFPPFVANNVTFNQPNGYTITFQFIWVPTTGFPAPAVANNNISLCAGGNATLEVVSGVSQPNNVFEWYDNPSLTGSPVAVGSQLSLNNIVAPASYWVAEVLDPVSTLGCPGASTQVTVGITPPPTAPNSANVSTCVGGTATLSASSGLPNAVFTWYDDALGNVALFSGATVTTPNLFAPRSYWVGISDPISGCQSPLAQVDVDLSLVLTPPIAPTLNICANEQAVLNATSGGGLNGTFRWYADANATNFVFGGNPYTTLPLLNNATYWVTEQVGTCESAPTQVNIVVSPAPASPNTSNASVCSGSSATLTATGAGNITWYADPTGFAVLGTGGSYNTSPLVQTSTFYVAQENGLGCESPLAPVVVSVTPVPASPTVSNLNVCVNDPVELTANIIGNGTVTWFDAAQNTIGLGFSPPNIQTLAVGPFANAGSNLFYVSLNDGVCESPRTPIAVNVSNIPAEPVVGNTTICEGESTTLTASGNFIYRWYDAAVGGNLLATGANFNTPVLNVTTTYYVAAFDGCESTRDTVIVVVTNSPASPTASNISICSGDNATLTANGAGTLNWYADASGNSLLATGNTYTTSPLTQSTTYYVGVSGANGCVSALTPVQVTVDATPAAPTASSIVLCPNAAGVLTATGSGNGSLNWYDNGLNLLATNAMPPATADYNVGPYAVAGNYVFYVSEDNGTCESIRLPLNVAVVTGPAAPVAQDVTICSGSSATLQALGANGVFTWYDAAVGGNVLANGAVFVTPVLNANTSYWVSVNTGCESTRDQVNVTVNPAPAAPTANAVSICSGETATLTANGVGTLSWYADAAGNGLLANGNTYTTGTLTQGTIYYVGAQAANGCTSALTSVTVNVNLTPAAPSSNSILLCPNEAGVLTATGSGNGSLNWYDAAQSLLTTNAMPPATATYNVGPYPTAGNYTFYVAEDNGTCESQLTPLNVAVSTAPAAPVAADVTICSGSSATLQALGANGVFTWYDAAVGGNVLANGSVFVTPALNANTSYWVSINNGCESPRDQVNVTINALPATPALASNAPLCEGSTLNLSTTAAGNLSYAWTGPNGFTANVAAPSINAVTEVVNQGTYFLVVTDNTTGCSSANGSLFVDIYPTPAALAFNSDSPACEGDDVILTAPALANATYSWYNSAQTLLANTNVPTYTISNVTAANTGIYYLSIAVNGCTSGFSNAFVTVNPTPAAPSVTNDGPVCAGEMATVAAATVNGGLYSWTGPNGFSSTQQSFSLDNITAAEAGTYSVAVSVNGCSSVAANTNLVVNALPATAVVSNNGPLCDGDDLQLNAQSVFNSSYAWTGPNGFTSTGQNPTIANADENFNAGFYTVVITDLTTGCSSLPASTLVEIASLPAAVLAQSNSPVCQGEELQLTATGLFQATYAWTGPNNFSSSDQNPNINNATDANQGTYEVVVSVGSCVSEPTQVNVVISAGPTVNAGADVTIEQGQSTQLQGDGGLIYSWTPSEHLNNPVVPNPIATPPVGVNTFTLTAYDSDNCAGSDEVVVTVTPSTQFFFPDLITPNGDGSNDAWLVGYLENIAAEYTLQIFTRNGIEVLNTNNYANDWDGTYEGNELPDGSYYYILRSGDMEYKGAVTIKR